MPSNDNGIISGVAPAAVDAHGRAALLLVESLIHGLCASATLGAGEAIEIAERAIAVEADHVAAAKGDGAPMSRSHALLSSIATSLRSDGHPAPPAPRLVS